MIQEKKNKFETMDFCYDLIDLLNKRDKKYIGCFFQITNKIDKIQIMHGGFSQKDCFKLIPNLLQYAKQKIEIGTIISNQKDIELTTLFQKIIQLNFKFIILSADEKNFYMYYHIDDKDSLIYSISTLDQMLGKIVKDVEEGEE